VRATIDRGVRVLSSFGLACILLILLGLLTWLGTLEQVHSGLYDVQKKYFESFFLVHRAGPVPVPLPGANLVLCALFVNLLAGGVVRLRKSRATAGILIAHLGIALLLASGFVKLYFSEDGYVTLYEGQRASHFESYYRWEIVASRELGGGRRQEFSVPQEDFADARGGRTVRLSSPEVPFDLEVRHFTGNCEPLPKGPMFDVPVPVVDGYFLAEKPRDREAERNLAGAYATLVDKASGARREGILWGVAAHPFTVDKAGEVWAIDLRKERYPMPFTVVLDEFTKRDHPRSTLPKEFSSDVTVIDGASSRPVEISMNEPLRDRGLVVYQASWGPANARPGDRLFSTLSVVRNPADQMPLYACIVIAAGLCLHFTRKLLRHVRSEARRS